jgi:hypothetical protein
MKNLFYSLMVLLLLCSCTTTVSVQHSNANAFLSKIERDRVIGIVPVDDGIFNGKVYTGSGSTILNYFTANLQPFASKTVTLDSKNYENEAKEIGVTYIVKPIITHWEPRVAARSGIPTRVEISVSVFDLTQDKSIINTNLLSKGKSMTFASQSAEGLAEILIQRFVKDIIE